MLMMRPPRRRRTSGMTSGRVTLKKPSSVVRVTSCQSASVIAGKGASRATPALLTTTSSASGSAPWVQGASARLVGAVVEQDGAAARRELLGDRGADAAAAARDQRDAAHFVGSSGNGP